jgi:hypothetical protein
MKTAVNTVKYTLSAVSIALLAACGGGGAAAPADQKEAAAPLTGVFVDAPVAGLSYSTDTQSGVTDAAGTFKYLPGETVTFKLYGMTIATPQGFSFLTPFDLGDLVDTSKDGTPKDVNYSVNLIRFLMALDEDGNPDNGIKLPAYSGTLDVDFNKSIREFGKDSGGLIAEFLAKAANGRQLPSVKDAVDHFNKSLANVPALVANYTLDLTNKTASSEVKDSKCINGAVAKVKYSFNATEVDVEGSDGFIDTNNSGHCTAMTSKSKKWEYSKLEQGQFLDCLPKCTYKQLNRITYINPEQDTDKDVRTGELLKRTIVEWSWHTPGTKKIYNVRAIINSPTHGNHPGSVTTFTEVITLE